MQLSLFNFFRPRAPHNRGRRRGTTLVETALCLVFILLPVTLGGFQFGMVFMTQHSLQQITRESARWSAVHYGDATFDGAVTQGDAAGQTPSLLNFVRRQAAANGIPWRDISGAKLANGTNGGSVEFTPADAGRISGQPLTLTITYPMRQRALLGSLFFKSNDGKKLAPLQLGFLRNDFSATSTILME